MKNIITVLFVFYSALVYGACADYQGKGSCEGAGCVWVSGGGGSCVNPPNTAPTNITLSASSVAENLAAGTQVGTFTTTDTAGDTHTYTLVSGTGSTDNASFTISGNQLLTNAVFNYEVKTSYSIRVRTTDQGGLFYEKVFTITITNVNEAPTVTSGATAGVNENIPISTTVYTITATDPDAGQTLTYGIGGPDAAYFNVNTSSGAITFKASPDFETKSSYSITVTATDNGVPPLSNSKAVTITVANVNETPTNISLDTASVAENQPSGTTVGNLSTTDPDAGNTFNYTIVGGDAASFSISGAQLKTAAAFDYETKNSYSVTIRSTDQGGLFFDKTFTITVTDVAEPPIAEFRMEELSWNGTAAEVKDSQGTYNATAGSLSSTKPTTAVLSPAIPSDPGTCRYGVFNRANKDYIALPSTFPNLGSSSFTITAWIRTTNNTAPGQRIFIDDATNTGGYGFSLADGGTGMLRFFSRGTPSALILDTPNVIANNTWYFVAAVADIPNKRKRIYVYNTAGTQLSAVTATWTEASFGTDAGIASIGGETNSGTESTNEFGFSGNIDEVRVYPSTLNASQLNQIRQETHPCPSTAPSVCSSFSYDLYHAATPSKLYTRIAQQPFDVNVSVACTGSTDSIPARQIKKIYAVTGTCPTATTGLQVLWNSTADINDTLRTITLSGLNSLKAYSNIRLMLETNASELNCSTDNMAIRPASFAITSPASSIRAADFTLQTSALNSGGGYNGTASVNTGLQIPNPNCPVSGGFITSNLGAAEPHTVTFQNDTNVSAMKATEVGAVYLDTKDSTWSAIDQPNDCILDSNATIANAQGLVGCTVENNLSMVIVPYRFDVNGTVSNFAGDTFTYLSDDLNMSAQLALAVTAKNGEGNTTKNYTSGCYAKNTTLTLPHSAVPSPLAKIFYAESLSGITSNVPKNSDINLTNLSTALFTQGAAPLALKLNFDRNRSQPLNPFDFTITSAAIVDTDGVSGSGTPLGNATFVYGRARAYDVTTNEASAPNPVEFEVYSTVPTGYVSAMPQNVLKWYRNLNHDTAAQGNVLRGAFSAGGTESAINVSALPKDGIEIVTTTASEDKTVHLDISPWLWYSPAYDYSYSAGCTQHPCFRYDYTSSDAGISGVSSGTFQGSDFEMAPAKNITNKGVKVFR